MTEETALNCQLAVVSKIKYKGTEIVVLEDVYEPAEDTFLLADCAVSEVSKLLPTSEDISSQNNKENEKDSGDFSVFEVGSGSGFVSAFLQDNFPSIRLTAVDINPNAVSCAQMNGVQAFEADMFDLFNELISESKSKSELESENQSLTFDLILFNPPYLPTAEDEKVDGPLNYAFDGGISGRDSIDRFLEEVGDYLKETGFFLLLISSITGLDETIEEMEINGFSAEVIGKTKCSFEELIVLKGKRL
ncbi:methyltransferase [Methanimicrococcus sp. OttesenSCG-928-J09]|nr:methyltransferase [Methanimicrococcus sp. OttesenSCG-928-J09]